MNDDTTAQVEELQAKLREYEKALGINNQDLLITFKLTPSLNSIFGLLLTQRLVTADMIERRLAIATEAKVAVHRLRMALKEWGIRIESKRNLGYWMSHDTKSTIKDFITQEITPRGNDKGYDEGGDEAPAPQ